MKKLIKLTFIFIITLFVTLSLTSCNTKSDLQMIKDNNKLVIGVTIYKPMDYIDDEGEWTGFDAELAEMFAESLGVNSQIVIITWSQKVAELDSKQIDLVWNGMTATDELAKEIDFSVSYAKNAQVAVVKKNSSITTKDDIKNSKIAVENSSAGHICASDEIKAKNITPLTAQIDAVNEVKAGTSDVCIIDITMAQNIIGKGEYSDLQIVDGVSYGDEIFAVGLRKGSDLKAKLDAFLKEKYADGTITKLAEKYNVGINIEALSK